MFRGLLWEDWTQPFHIFKGNYFPTYYANCGNIILIKWLLNHYILVRKITQIFREK